MTDKEFQAAYQEALSYQASGDAERMEALLGRLKKAGAPMMALEIIGALAEATLQFRMNPNETT